MSAWDLLTEDEQGAVLEAVQTEAECSAEDWGDGDQAEAEHAGLLKTAYQTLLSGHRPGEGAA